jgi:hypothetical protein
MLLLILAFISGVEQQNPNWTYFRKVFVAEINIMSGGVALGTYSDYKNLYISVWLEFHL